MRSTKRHRTRARVRDERGEALVGFVLTGTVVWITLLLTVQVAVWGYTRHVANTAARGAAQRAATETGSAAAARAFATDFTTRAAGSWLQDREVTVVRGSDTVTITVTGSAIELVPVPFWDLRVRAQAVDPVERFVSR